MKLFHVTCSSILAASVLFSLQAFAGGGSIAGGNALICFDDATIAKRIKDSNDPKAELVTPSDRAHITSIEALDLIKAKSKAKRQGVFGNRKVELLLIGKDESFIDYINRTVGRLYRVTGLSMFSKEEISKYYQQLFNEDEIDILDAGIAQVNDLGHVATVSDQCAYVTIISQRGEPTSPNLLIELDDELFFHDLHSRESQAIFVMHELIYRALREIGATTAEQTRNIVTLAITQDDTDFEKLSTHIQEYFLQINPEYCSSRWAPFNDESSRIYYCRLSNFTLLGRDIYALYKRATEEGVIIATSNGLSQDQMKTQMNKMILTKVFSDENLARFTDKTGYESPEDKALLAKYFASIKSEFAAYVETPDQFLIQGQDAQTTMKSLTDLYFFQNTDWIPMLQNRH